MTAANSSVRQSQPGGPGPRQGRDVSRRDFLYLATGATAAVGGAAAVWPFIDQMNPSAAQRALATIEADLSPVQEGMAISVMWRKKPVFLRKRTQAEIEQARSVDPNALPDPEPDTARVKRPEWLIVVGVCTHLGCIPLGNKQSEPRGDYGGWFCACHGSHYDTAGRVRKGPAPSNLVVPPYEFVDDTTVRIG
jgi:ubiquinol-cytochrome c reductase iron-sulfur subunit